jgi:probable O-glycosylation ligase (exosortase A-associated)
MKVAYAGVAFLAVLTAVGTFERSALVGLVVLAVYLYLRSRRKLLYGAVLGVGVLVGLAMSVQDWNTRVVSLEDYTKESSAMTRLLMWQWTLEYVGKHPMGGSFDAYGVSTIFMPPDAMNPGGWIQIGRAYHSIYFEVLGDLGWPGEIMFLVAAGSTLIGLVRLTRKCRKVPELVWVADMSDAVQAGIMVFLTSGAFVGIAFQPPFWYFVAMGVCLRAYVWHAERVQDETVTGWRLAARQAREGGLPGWQKPPALANETPLDGPGWRGARNARSGGP